MKSANTLPDEDIMSKIETVEGKTLYVISRLKSHPINLKTYFSLGYITIFEEGKKTGYYKGEVVSLESLNQHMEWTSDYFKRLRACLEGQNKDVTYSFASTDDESDEQLKYFKIIFKISKGADVRNAFISTNKVLESLMTEMMSINQTKKKAIRDLEKKIENLETEKMVILENMNDVAQAKEQLENELLDKFTVILNEKKRKIAALNQELDLLRTSKKGPTAARGDGEGMTVEKPTKTEEEFPTQLTTYQLDVNGSQFNWVRNPKSKDKKRIDVEKHDPTSHASTLQAATLADTKMEKMDKVEPPKKKETSSQLSLSDLLNL